MSNKIIKVIKRRIILPYVQLFYTASCSLSNAQQNSESEYFDSLSCILFCALCLEAYLNHVGAASYKTWDEDLEALNPKAKLRLISTEKMKINIDFSCSPFQSFNDIFRFRNRLAHGKTEIIEDKIDIDGIEGALADQTVPLANWENLCTVKEASRLLKNTEEMIRFLHSHTPARSLDPFYAFGVTTKNYIHEGENEDDYPRINPEHFVY